MNRPHILVHSASENNTIVVSRRRSRELSVEPHIVCKSCLTASQQCTGYTRVPKHSAVDRLELYLGYKTRYHGQIIHLSFEAQYNENGAPYGE